MNYLTRSMTADALKGPRESDPGYARHLAAQLRLAVHQRGNHWTVERYGKPIHSSPDVRGVVGFLRGLLDRGD